MLIKAKYHEIRKDFGTGDVILFSGNNAISNLIKGFTRSKFSHVGMCMKLREYDTVFLWESTTLSNIKNLDGKRKYKNGVQMTLLSDRIRKYDGKIYWRALHSFVFDEAKLFEFRKEVGARNYEEHKSELFNAAVDFADKINIFLNEEDLSSIFCSELIAETYQGQKLLNEDKPSNEYIPKDFSEKGKLKLENEAYLDREIQII